MAKDNTQWKVVLISDSAKVIQSFNTLKRSSSIELEHLSTEDYLTRVTPYVKGWFIYFDITKFTNRMRNQLLKFIQDHENLRFGIVDPGSLIEDPAQLILQGASDYIGKSMLGKSIPLSRFTLALDFYESEETEDNETSQYWDWNSLNEHQEYTFIFLFIEIDLPEDWIQKSGREHLDQVMKYFYKHLNSRMKNLNGRLWIETERGGLVLIPHINDGEESIIECFKIVLDRLQISAEDYPYNMLISYRMALHLGKTVYRKKGSTGSVISDSVNYIFHLGKQYLEEGQFSCTEEIFQDCPEALQNYFYEDEEFQDKRIFTMREPMLNI
jgi:hypothetical protein